ncbi:hypothetical protein Tco_1510359 [Tanacetum coccineum]
MSAGIAEAATLSPSSFCKRYRSSYETSSSSSLTLPVRKRYRERVRQGLDDEGHGLGDEDHGLGDESQGLEDKGLGFEEEEEEAAPEGQQQAVLVVDIAVSEPLGLGYGAARRRALESIKEITPSTYKVGQSSSYAPPAAPVQTSPSPEWSLGSLPISPSSPVVPSPIVSLVATPTATISVDEDQFIEVGVQLELYGSILYDYTQHLDTLPPTLFVDIDMDERTAMSFGALWRPVLALEAWAAMQRELQEMRGRVTALEQERDRREQ